uniref:Uncharacterized protein n=1 Tax=Megaselia scalaris TaxID=36166 RepID=T1GFG0_MEGSC
MGQTNIYFSSKLLEELSFLWCISGVTCFHADYILVFRVNACGGRFGVAQHKKIGKEQFKIKAPGETLSNKRNMPESITLKDTDEMYSNVMIKCIKIFLSR